MYSPEGSTRPGETCPSIDVRLFDPSVKPVPSPSDRQVGEEDKADINGDADYHVDDVKAIESDALLIEVVWHCEHSHGSDDHGNRVDGQPPSLRMLG